MHSVTRIDKEQSLATVKAHSSGPEVERGKCPNLGFVVSLGWDDMLREER